MSAAKEALRLVLRHPMVNPLVTRPWRWIGRTPLGGLASRIPVVGTIRLKGPSGRTMTMMSDGLDPIAGSVFWKGLSGYEPGVIEAIRTTGDRGGVALDIGANTGIYSLFLGGLGFEKVIAFEPVSIIHERLLRNLELNGLAHVEGLRMAVSDREESIVLHVPRTVSVPSSASINDDFFPETYPETVECTSIDGFLREQDPGRVSFAKIDVEGGELTVLRGMRGVLEEHKPVVLCEILRNSNLDELSAFMSACRYRILNIQKSGLVPVPDLPDWEFQPRRYNFLLVPSTLSFPFK